MTHTFICNTHETFKKRMNGRLSNALGLFKNRRKFDSFANHFEQHFKSTTLHTDLRKCMAFKVVKHTNHIAEMKTFTKPNCSLCVEERLKIIKKRHTYGQ